MLRKDAHLAEEKLVVNDTARARRVRKRTLCSVLGYSVVDSWVLWWRMVWEMWIDLGGGVCYSGERKDEA